MSSSEKKSGIDSETPTVAGIILRSAVETDLVRATEIISMYPQALFKHHDYEYLMKFRHFPEVCLVAEHHGSVVGVLLGYRGGRSNETFFLWQIAVDKQYQRKGIGFALVSRASSNAQARCCTRLEGTITSHESMITLTKLARAYNSQLVRIGSVRCRTADLSDWESEPLYEIDFE